MGSAMTSIGGLRGMPKSTLRYCAHSVAINSCRHRYWRRTADELVCRWSAP
jgi:hypothetical protein